MRGEGNSAIEASFGSSTPYHLRRNGGRSSKKRIERKEDRKCVAARSGFPIPFLFLRSADAKTREEITEMAVTNCEESKEGSILILAGGAAEETCTSQRSPHSFLGLPAAMASIRAAGGRPRAA